jgi:putative thioredoxin
MTAVGPSLELMASAPETLKVEVDQASFATEVLERSTDRPVVVDFWAAWCGPCRQLGPVLEQEVARLEGQVLLRAVDVDQSPELARMFGIRGIPAVKAFRDGHVVAEFVGAQPAPQVRSFLQGLLPSEADLLAEGGDEASLRAALSADPSHLPARRRLAELLLREGRSREAGEVAALAPQDRVCDGLCAWAQLQEESMAADARLLAALRAGDFAQAATDAIRAVADSSGERRDLLRRLAILCFEQLGPEHPAVGPGRASLASSLY